MRIEFNGYQQISLSKYVGIYYYPFDGQYEKIKVGCRCCENEEPLDIPGLDEMIKDAENYLMELRIIRSELEKKI